MDASSGALVVTGGVGIGEDLNVGQSMSVEGMLELRGLNTSGATIGTSLDVSAGDILVSSGNIDVSGDVSIGGNITFGGKLGGNVQVVNTPTTLGNHYMVLVDSGTTITLPDLNVSTNQGVVYHIIKRVALTVTIQTTLTDVIVEAGGTVTTIDLDGLIHDRISLIGDDDNKWYTI
jgi:hypothetical protein